MAIDRICVRASSEIRCDPMLSVRVWDIRGPGMDTFHVGTSNSLLSGDTPVTNSLPSR